MEKVLKNKFPLLICTGLVYSDKLVLRILRFVYLMSHLILIIIIIHHLSEKNILASGRSHTDLKHE